MQAPPPVQLNEGFQFHKGTIKTHLLQYIKAL